MATVVLGMTEEQFWNSTLKKLLALLKVHREFKGTYEEDECFIDEIF
jgi:hypothetical protein